MRKGEALSILEIPSGSIGSNTYDSAYITKAYRIASLKYHPDKNENSPESTAKFQQINEAYQYLMSKTTTITTTTTTDLPSSSSSSYHDIFVFFIRAMFNRNGPQSQSVNVNSDDIEAALMHIISSNYDKLLHTLDKSTAVTVYEFMREYADILHLPSDALEKMFKIVSDKMKSDNVIILNPTLTDVFQKKVYDLEYDSKRFTVPLWHNEIYYKLDNDADLVVRCNISDMPEYMYIDENNHITINIRTSVQKLLDTGSVTVCIPVSPEPLSITIPCHELVVMKNVQVYKCPDPIGIPRINTRNPLDDTIMAGVNVCIELY
jgi:hypothetical protein